jgi:hypothetical protein
MNTHRQNRRSFRFHSALAWMLPAMASVGFVACAPESDPNTVQINSEVQAKIPALNQEASLADQAGEPELFTRLGVELTDLQKKYKDTNGGLKRGFHAKPHACVMGKLQVLPERSAESKFGIFAETKTYPAWIRISNARPVVDDDNASDIRGIAVKVLGVPGAKLMPGQEDALTQDFLGVTTDTLGAKNADDFMLFQKAINGDMLAFGALAFRDIGLLGRLKQAIHPIESMFKERFWSGVPFKLGARASKYSFIPCASNTVRVAPEKGKQYLHEDAVQHLEAGDSCFDLAVQFQRDPVKQPVEDSSVSWKESEAPFTPVARLILPKQDMHSAEAARKGAFCENLVWNPWHSLAAHQPLGNANRARKIVMVAAQKFRGAPMPAKEPSGNETF